MAKKKIKDSLRKVFLNEFQEVKEEERKERAKENANLKEVIAYTDSKQPHSKRIIDQLKDEGIKVKEMEILEHPKDWASIRTITGTPGIPAIVINKNILHMKRDFSNVKQLIMGIKHYANPDFVNPDFEGRMLEMTKTNTYNLMMRFNALESKLNPLMQFVTNLQKQLAEEEKEEKTANEQKNK